MRIVTVALCLAAVSLAQNGTKVVGKREFLGEVDLTSSPKTKIVRVVSADTSGACTDNNEWQWNPTTRRLFACASGTWYKMADAAGLGGISSFAGRTGVVTPQTEDYASFYASLAGSYANPTWITSLAASKLTGPLALSLLSQSGATVGQLLAWNGMSYVPVTRPPSAIPGPLGTVLIDPVTGETDVDIVELDAQPHAFTSVADLSGATVVKPFKRVTTAPSGGCNGAENAIQMVAATGAKWRCDETTDTWVADGAPLANYAETLTAACTEFAGGFFPGSPLVDLVAGNQVAVSMGGSGVTKRLVCGLRFEGTAVNLGFEWKTQMPISATTMAVQVKAVLYTPGATGNATLGISYACVSDSDTDYTLSTPVSVNVAATNGAANKFVTFANTFTLSGCVAGDAVVIRVMKENTTNISIMPYSVSRMFQ